MNRANQNAYLPALLGSKLGLTSRYDNVCKDEAVSIEPVGVSSMGVTR